MEKIENLDDPGLLMGRAKRGDAAAFGELYDMYFTPVFRYIFARVREKETASDLAQTVFLKVFQARERYMEYGKPLAYFFTVARNAVIDHWKKKKEVSLETEEVFVAVATDDDPHEAAERSHTAQVIMRGIGLLTQDQQEIITMKFMSDLSNKEIAAATGRTEEAVRQLQCRALAALRRHFKDLHIL